MIDPLYLQSAFVLTNTYSDLNNKLITWVNFENLDCQIQSRSFNLMLIRSASVLTLPLGALLANKKTRLKGDPDK